MKFVRLSFPDSVFSPPNYRNSFYEETTPDLRIPARGLLLAPDFSKETEESSENQPAAP